MSGYLAKSKGVEPHLHSYNRFHLIIYAAAQRMRESTSNIFFRTIINWEVLELNYMKEASTRKFSMMHLLS
jgi:hypothetical protein